jgi:alpha-glucosidase
LLALVCSLRGSVCLYQGEELGLAEADVGYEQLRDPYGIAFWPNFKGRDGCRTPMPWNDALHAGFSTAAPWLPVAGPHRALAVSAQESDPESTLHAARAFLRWRKQQPALLHGSIRFLDAPEPVLAFVREHAGQRLLLAFNLSSLALAWNPPDDLVARALELPGLETPAREGAQWQLPAHGVLVAALD